MRNMLRSFKQTANWSLLLLAATRLLLPFITHRDFGFHRDEFLYLAMGDHLGWGYLEVPPFIAFLSSILSVFSMPPLELIRFIPALGGAVTAVLTGLITRKLGGGVFAQNIAVLAYLLSLVFLRINNLYQPVTFDIMFFVLSFFLFINILEEPKPKYWILLGITLGIGLLNKYTMLLFPLGAAVGVFLSPHRILVKDKWLWIAMAITLLIWLPNLLWQQQQGWPFFEHMRALSAYQFANMNPFIFTIVQFLMNIHAVWLWILGLVFFLFSSKAGQWRPLGWIFVSLFIILLMLSGKPYYLVAVYPMLFAGGACVLERFRAKKQRRWVLPLSVALILAGSIPMIPAGIPVFSVEGMVDYFRKIGITEALRWEDGEIHALPQDYADMLGWEEMVQAVAKTWHSLPDSERSDCALFTSNYGQAGAIDYYSERYELPASISKGSSYWLWGYRDYDGSCMVVAGLNDEAIARFYNIVIPGASYHVPYAREDDTAIYIASDPKLPIDSLWQILRAYRY
jgi:4-amino-4-deoxy-L-arabinose transferase-like glycosyltransferase